MSAPRIAAAIVTMNKKDAVLALLARLRDDGIPACVTTNACTDGTPGAIRAAYPAVRVLDSDVNLGGTGGFNCAVLAALETGAPYVALVDDDALPEPGCLSKLADFLDAHPDCVWAAPAIHIASRPELVQECGGDVRFDREVAVEAWYRYHRNEGLRTRTDVGYASACTLVVRADRIRDVGVMDWIFFLFYDDVDWTLRLRGERFRGACIPSVRSLHDYPWAKPLALTRLYYFHRNGLLLLARWRPRERTLRSLRGPLARLVRDALQSAAAGDHELGATLVAALRDAWTRRYGPWQSVHQFPEHRRRIDAAAFRSAGHARVLVNIRNEQLLPEIVASLRALGGDALAIDAIGDPGRMEALRDTHLFRETFARDLRRRALLAQLATLRRRRYDLVVTDTAIEPRNAFDAVGRAAAFFHAGELYEAAHRPWRLVAGNFLAPTLGKIAAWALVWRLAARPPLGEVPDAARALLARAGIPVPDQRGAAAAAHFAASTSS